MRNKFGLSSMVSVVALTLTAVLPAAGAAGAQSSAVPPAAVATVVTPSPPRTLYISVANRYLTMPHRIAAGRYYVQVRTSDPRSTVQVVRPPAGYTPRQFLDAKTRWSKVYNSNTDPLAAYKAFVRSVTFMGGAQVARGGVSAFATGFSAGTYWLYEDTYQGPTHLARIVVLTVVGTPPAQAPFPTVGLVRFYPTTYAVTMPGHLPAAGWLMGLGGAPLNTLSIVKLMPGVTNADLDTDGICNADFATPTKDCYQDGGMDLGGEVSAGASVFWHYHLTPGDYIAGNVGPTEIFDHPFYDFNRYTRFTVS